VVVTLPADARLTIDGEPTTATGERRVFETPALSPGWSYHYLLVAEVALDGKPLKMQKRVEVTAGKEVAVTLAPPAPPKTRGGKK
jgi:uncharacterized protein (TIGR03000 family)